MKKFLALTVVVLGYLLLAQAANAVVVVSSCTGLTVPTTFSGELYVDTTGKLCVNVGGGSVDITQWAGGTLGAMANYGTSPGAVLVPGVNAFITNPIPAGTNIIGGIGASKHLVSSTLTKITGAGTYTGATTTAPLAICLFASVTPCAPLTMTVSATTTVTGYITGIMLEKSTTGATGATFRVFVYKAAPTLTGVFNTSVYLALAADITSGAYVGSWECSTQVVNTDNSYYDCSANRPSGNNAFNLTDGTLQFVIVATGAYVSGSSETFVVTADLLTSVP